MHISLIGIAKLVLNWGTLHSAFVPSTQELLGSTLVPPMTTAVHRKWRGCFDAPLRVVFLVYQLFFSFSARWLV